MTLHGEYGQLTPAEWKAEVTELRDRITKLERNLDTVSLSRDFLAGERDRLLQAVEENRVQAERDRVLIKTLGENLLEQQTRSMGLEARLVALQTATQAVSDEWTAYIGSGDDEGHDDPVLVGERIADLRVVMEVGA